MSTIRFATQLSRIGPKIILRLPKSASARLSSRGMAMVEGTINGLHFQAALEPDRRGSHWFEVDETRLGKIGAKAGDTVNLESFRLQRTLSVKKRSASRSGVNVGSFYQKRLTNLSLAPQSTLKYLHANDLTLGHYLLVLVPR